MRKLPEIVDTAANLPTYDEQRLYIYKKKVYAEEEED